MVGSNSILAMVVEVISTLVECRIIQHKKAIKVLIKGSFWSMSYYISTIYRFVHILGTI